MGGCSQPRRPLPPGLCCPPAAPRERGAGEGLAPAWGSGLGARGRRRHPGKVTEAEAGLSAVGAGSRGGRPRCRRECLLASAAAASETRLLPRAPGAQSWAAAAAAAGSRAPLAGARSPPPAPGQAGAVARGPAGGAGGRALGSGLRAGPNAACPERGARSAAAVTVCLCHVCAAGGDREPGPGSERGRGQRPPWRPPPPRDSATGQWQTPQPREPRGRPHLGSAHQLGSSLCFFGCSHAGGSNTRIRDPGPGQDERVQAGSSPPFFPQSGLSRPLRGWRASRKEGEGKRGGSAAAAVETLAGSQGPATSPVPLVQSRRRKWEVSTASTLLLGSPLLRSVSRVWAPRGCERPRLRALTTPVRALYPRFRSQAPSSFGETALLCTPIHIAPCTLSTPPSRSDSFLLFPSGHRNPVCNIPLKGLPASPS